MTKPTSQKNQATKNWPQKNQTPQKPHHKAGENPIIASLKIYHKKS